MVIKYFIYWYKKFWKVWELNMRFWSIFFLADYSSQRKMLGSLCGFESQVSFLLILAGVGAEYDSLSRDWEPRIRLKLKDLRKIMGSMLEAWMQFYLFNNATKINVFHCIGSGISFMTVEHRLVSVKYGSYSMLNHIPLSAPHIPL